MEAFGVLLIAVDDYPDPPGPLPSSASAKRFSAILTGNRGGVVIDSVVARSREDFLGAFDRWVAPNAQAPGSSIIYLAGHGTDDGLDHDFIVPGAGGTTSIRTSDLARFFEKDWFRRQADGESWTLLILDCCASDIGVTNLRHTLTGKAVKKPQRLSFWPVAPGGASRAGRFIEAFSQAISTFRENDAVIRLNDLFGRMRSELGNPEPEGYLPDDAVLQNPLHTPTPVVMNLDAHAELRRVIAGLPDGIRNHFLAKAQGAEAGDVAWYFSGREKETESLSSWLRTARGGLRVVTGEAGCGKSALLGHLFVLTDDQLTAAYTASELAPDLSRRTRPPSGVFDAALHLTGRTLAQTFDDLAAQAGSRVGQAGQWNEPDDVFQSLRNSKRTVTILADALDEAQEPERIADFLRQAVAADVARVVVGTRRSLGEGPDQPYEPDNRELLDALGARPEDLVVIDRDSAATRDYVVRRLSAAGSPYAGNRAAIEALADKVAAVRQPMLFARLVTSELLARPPVRPDDPALNRLLANSHRGVFVAAVDRLLSEDPATVVMLRALALGRGRGVPETGGTWLAIARAIADDVALPDTAVRTTIERAAAYVLLDAEAGQSVYRLSHRTFVEHFRSRPQAPAEHRKVAVALCALVDRTGGWEIANHYLVRYLPEHFTADPDRGAVDADGLAGLVTDAGWLARAMALLGVDGVVDALARARRSLEIPLVETVERALRRSRVALGREPAQLPGQMHARSRNEADPRLSELGNRLGKQAGQPWLRMTRGALEWRGDLETTYGAVGKVRALAFGHVDDQPVVAIGIDDSIRLWDPRRGQSGERVFGNDGRRLTALALSQLHGRPVVVAAASYDRIAVIRDVRSGAVVGPEMAVEDYVNSIALGLLGDRVAVAGSGDGALVAWDARTGARLSDLPTSLAQDRVLGVSELKGCLVAHVVRAHGGEYGAYVVDLATGADVWAGQRLPQMPTLIAAGQGRSDYAIAASFSNGAIVSWLGGSSAGHPGDTKGEDGVDVRALAVGEVHGRSVVVHTPDYETTALVSLTLSSPSSEPPVPEESQPPRWILDQADLQAVFAIEANEAGGNAAPRIVVLTDTPLTVRSLDDDAPIDPAPDRDTVTLALTGMRRSDIDFRGAAGSSLAHPPHPTARVSPDAPFRLDDPRTWPRSAQCRGIVGERAVIATGSIGGSVWLWDVLTHAVVAGPFTDVPEHKGARAWSRRALRMKGGPSLTSSVALGRHPHHGDVLAIAHEGSVRLVSVPSGDAIPTPADKATVVNAVALGRVLDEEVLVTGSQGGVVVVWGLASDRRIAALTIDSSVEKVWVVHGTDAVAVQTMYKGDRTLFILDVRAE